MVSANRRYLIDQSGQPFLMTGDSPQALIVNMSPADATQYFSIRRAEGFNTVWINLLCDQYTGGRSDGSTYDGIVPFMNQGDLSTPNEVYFARVDQMLSIAAQYGFLVLLDPAETGGWLSVVASNDIQAVRGYGQYLGTRYRNFNNIIWMSGNDFQSWTNPTDDAYVQAVALGIKDTDARHIHTVELNYKDSTSLDDSAWSSIISLNAAYTYSPTYIEVLRGYNNSNVMPVFMVEANYEWENDYRTPATLRRQEYWSLLSGATGQLYSNELIWPVSAGWQTALNSPGSVQMANLVSFFSPRRWYDLIPDQNHTLVSGGYGTFGGIGNSVNDTDYVTAAATADGRLAIVYLPAGNTITVQLSTFAGPVTANWFDPASGRYLPASSSAFANTGASQFLPPGLNGDGQPDWVLLLEAQSVLPTVVIDSPHAGSVLSGITTISGWALENTEVVGTAISRVQVWIDGVLAGNATYGLNRADVCAAYPGRPGCPNVGFSYQLNLSTLAAGPHTIVVGATDSSGGYPNIGNAQVSITVAGTGTPPSVYIDSPASGALLSGTVTVAGWAIDNTTTIGTAISSVQMKVDGVVAGNATYGVSRPDVCAAWPGRPGCPNVGFAYSLNATLLIPGLHSLTAVATDSDGTPMSSSWSTTFQTIVAPSVIIDSPTAGATVFGTVTIAGWTIDNTSAVGTAISSVQVLVDGATVGTATYGISRPDVCNAYPGRPSCPNVGFAYQLNTALLSPGQHKITVTATDSDGTPDTGLASVNVTVAAIPPTVHIDTPVAASALSGVVAISGWAVDNSSLVGTAISSVQVLVDGAFVGYAAYGQSRPDVCNAYPGRLGCPNVGFTYQLNLGTLSPGSHMITVSVTDTDGTPDVGTDSVTITVVSVPPSVYIDSPSSGAVVSGVVTVGGWALDNTSGDRERNQRCSGEGGRGGGGQRHVWD
jgi:hypothetical protein